MNWSDEFMSERNQIESEIIQVTGNEEKEKTQG